MPPSPLDSPQVEPVRRAGPSHSRQSSTTVGPIHPSASESRPSSSRKQPAHLEPAPTPQVHYTCFIRLPFPRNGFDDPPPLDWDFAKDRQLWKVISKASNSQDLNWEAMSAKFDVPLSFLLQQAAWLYERHFEGMKAQMRKLGAAGTLPGPSTSPKPTQEVVGGARSGVGSVGMARIGSKDSRLPSTINTQRAAQLPLSEAAGSPGTPRSVKSPLSRTPSTTTVTQSRVFSSTLHQPSQRAFRGSNGSQNKPTAPSKPVQASHQHDGDESPLDQDRSSESESGAPTMARSQASKRTVNRKPMIGAVRSNGDEDNDDDDDDDDDDEDSGAYLPFAAAVSRIPKDDPPAATSRPLPKRQSATPMAQHPAATASKPSKPKAAPPISSSASSAASSGQRATSNEDRADASNRAGALSPRRRAELEKLSPRYRKSGSEGSPSMGSSFSDLDDASVTRSALEDALLSNIQQHGSIGLGMGSRMSSLRDALSRK